VEEGEAAAAGGRGEEDLGSACFHAIVRSPHGESISRVANRGKGREITTDSADDAVHATRPPALPPPRRPPPARYRYRLAIRAEEIT